MRLVCWDFFFLWPLIIYKKKSGGYWIHLLFSMIIWYYTTVETSLRIGIVLLYVGSSVERFLFYILGVILYRKTDDSAYFHILPILFYKKGAVNTWFIIFPILWVKSGPNSTNFFLFPFLNVRVTDDAVHFLLIPVFYAAKMSHGFRVFLIPFIWISGSNDGYKFILAPIFFVIKTSEKFRFILFPLIWYAKSLSTTTLWFAPVWYRQSGETTTVCFIPAFYYRRTNALVFVGTLPVWFVRWSDGSFGYSIAFLVYHFGNAAAGTGRFILFPILWYYKYAESGDWRFVFFPLLWLRKSPTTEHTVLFPIVWVSKTGHLRTILVLPVYYKIGNVLFIFPLYYGKRNSESDYFFILLLFYYHKINTATSWCLFPLLWGHTNPDINFSRFIFFPVFYYIKSPDETVVHFWPIFGKTTKATSTSYYVAWPMAVFTFSEDSTKSHIFPLFNYKRDKDSSLFVSLLVYRKKTETTHILTVIPVYFYHQKPDYKLRVIVPALYISRFSAGNLFRYGFVVYLKLINAKEHTTFVYIFPFYGRDTRGHSSVRHFLLYPLFARRVDKEADVYILDVLWPLFHYETTPSVKSLRALIYWRRTTPWRDFRIVLPLYFSITQKATREVSQSGRFELAESGQLGKSDVININESPTGLNAEGELPITEEDGGSGSVALAEISKPNENARKYETEIVSKIQVLFPFFIRRETALLGFIFGSPCLIFPPLFIKKWDKKTGDYTTRLFPLYSHQKKGTTDTKTILIVLMRYFKDIEMNIVRFNLLCYFYHRTKEYTSYFLFPLFYRSKGTEYESFIILILYFFSKHKGEGGFERTAIFWLHPHYCTLISRFKAPTYTTTFFFPFFWRQNTHETRRIANSVFWIHPKIALAKYRHQDEHVKLFVFPLFHLRNDGPRKTFSLLWCILPDLAMYRVISQDGETAVRWLWPFFYHRTTEGSFLCFLWIHPFIAMIKSITHPTEGRTIFFFPLFYYRVSPSFSLFSLLWLFHPYAAFFARVRRMEEESTQTWMFPVFYNKHAPLRTEFAFAFLVHPRISLSYYMRADSGAKGLSYFFLLFWHKFDENTTDFGLIWIFHFKASFIYWHKNYLNQNNKFYFWPLIWVSNEQALKQFAFLYFYPPRISFISSTGGGQLTIWLIYSTRYVGENLVHSLLYFLHPKLCFIQLARGPNYFSVWMLLIFYYATEGEESYFSLIWIHPRKGYAFITRNTFGKGDMASHIFLLYWKCVEDNNLSFGLFWLFFYKLSLFAYYDTPECTKHYLLVLYYCKSNSEVWTLSILLWLIYITNSSDLFQLRLIYRFFRIATGRKKVVELQPFFHYSSKNGEYRFVVLGSLFGWGRSRAEGNYVQILCCRT